MSDLRRIEQRHPTTGELIGVLQTSLSDEELAERTRQQAAHREAMLAANLSAVTAERDAARAQEEALSGVGVDPEARAALRAAHQRLASARAELARRQEVVAAAAAHVGRCQTAYDSAKALVDRVAARAASAIIEQLEQGQQPQGPTPTRAAAERAEAALADLEAAIAARAEVERAAAAAERAEAESATRVREAARGVVRGWIFDLRTEIDELAEQLAARRERLNRLMPTLTERRWEVPWPAEAEVLLTDPGAALELEYGDGAKSAA